MRTHAEDSPKKLSMDHSSSPLLSARLHHLVRPDIWESDDNASSGASIMKTIRVKFPCSLCIIYLLGASWKRYYELFY
jgi:hypothetical protein